MENLSCPIHHVLLTEMDSFTHKVKVCAECNAEELARERRARLGQLCVEPGEKAPDYSLKKLGDVYLDTSKVDKALKDYHAAYPHMSSFAPGDPSQLTTRTHVVNPRKGTARVRAKVGDIIEVSRYRIPVQQDAEYEVELALVRQKGSTNIMKRVVVLRWDERRPGSSRSLGRIKYFDIP